MLEAFLASSTNALFGGLGALQEMAVRHLLAHVMYIVVLMALSRSEKEELTHKYPHTSQDMGKSGVPPIAHLPIHLDPQEPAMGSRSCTQRHGRGSESTSCWLDDLKILCLFWVSSLMYSLVSGSWGRASQARRETQKGCASLN